MFMDENKNTEAYQLSKSGTGTARFKESEIQEVNERIQKLQQLENISLPTFKDVFKAAIDRALTVNTSSEVENTPPPTLEDLLEENQRVITIDESLQARIADVIKTIGYENTPSLTDFISDLIEIATTVPDIPTAEIKEVIKEVPAQIGENQILLDLSSKQIETVNKISAWRHQNGHDNPALEPSDIVKRMVFNKGSLTNWHGEFPTGIRLKDARNQ